MFQLVRIGKLKKPHGIRGHLKILVDQPYWEDFLEADVLFLVIDGKEAPYFMEEIQEGTDILVKLEEVDSPEEAKVLSGKEVFLRQSDVTAIPEHEFFGHPSLEFLLGFLVEDLQKGRIGEIEEILELPQQWMAVVVYEGGEVLIPLHDQLIIEIAEKDKRLIMDLPEGLLDL